MAENRSNDDELDLFEARKAVSAAHFSATKTDAAVASARRANSGIRTIVEANGFVEKFRAVVQGGMS